MLEVDLHSHTLFSQCGLHTIVEMLGRARDLGMKGLAITDHSTAVDGRVNGNFFWRLRDPVDGIRMLKGIECNLLTDRGRTDLPFDYVRYMDVILLGIHYNVPTGQGSDRNTEMLLAALKANPQVDILTHPHLPDHELDMQRVALACRKSGMVMELNNSKCPPGSPALARMSELIKICMEMECRVVVSSDAHSLREIGNDDAVRPLIDAAKFPAELIVNRDADTAFAFIDERRRNKRS